MCSYLYIHTIICLLIQLAINELTFFHDELQHLLLTGLLLRSYIYVQISDQCIVGTFSDGVAEYGMSLANIMLSSDPHFVSESVCFFFRWSVGT